MTPAATGPKTIADLTVGPAPIPEVRPQATNDVGHNELLLEESVPQVDESVVRVSLQALGGLLSYPLSDDDVVDHWRFTDRELNDLTPPLTRIVNRNARLRRAVIRGDEVAVAVAFGGYVGRNMTEGHKARKVRRERDGEAEAAEGNARAGGPGVAPGGLGWRPGAGHGDFHDDAGDRGVDR